MYLFSHLHLEITCNAIATQDVTGAVNSEERPYAGGYAIGNEHACCRLCAFDLHCIVAVYRPSKTACWPVQSYTGFYNRTDRKILPKGMEGDLHLVSQ